MSWMATKINVGFVVAGRIGRVHAENLAYHIPAANLAAVADVFLEAAEKCAADYQISTVTQNPQDIFNKGLNL
jgi:myo-inositol 2-dehydrogenase/D-chiro-inositol 1-dehydrogenase